MATLRCLAYYSRGAAVEPSLIIFFSMWTSSQLGSLQRHQHNSDVIGRRISLDAAQRPPRAPSHEEVATIPCRGSFALAGSSKQQSYPNKHIQLFLTFNFHLRSCVLPTQQSLSNLNSAFDSAAQTPHICRYVTGSHQLQLSLPQQPPWPLSSDRSRR